MLHAVIRSGDHSVHMIGDLTEYNLETLVEHARHGLACGEDVSVRVEVDSSERDEFLARSQRWMRRLARSGVRVDVNVVRTPTMGAARSRVGRVGSS